MTWDNVLTLLGMLVMVFAILVLAYFATRSMAKFKMGRMKLPSGGNDGHMEVLDQLPLGADMRLVLVRTGSRFLLLGLSAAGISLLAELSEEEAANWLEDKSRREEEKSNHPSFRDSFIEVLKTRRK